MPIVMAVKAGLKKVAQVGGEIKESHETGENVLDIHGRHQAEKKDARHEKRAERKQNRHERIHGRH